MTFTELLKWLSKYEHITFTIERSSKFLSYFEITIQLLKNDQLYCLKGCVSDIEMRHFEHPDYLIEDVLQRMTDELERAIYLERTV